MVSAYEDVLTWEPKNEERKEMMKQDLSNKNEQKWEMLIDLLEHPENYTETQKDELLSDEEVQKLYQQLVETREAFDFGKSKEGMSMPDISEEWEKLMSEERKVKSEETKTVRLWSPMRKVAAVAAILVVSGIALAAIHLTTHSRQISAEHSEIVTQSKDTTAQKNLSETSCEKTDTAMIVKMPLLYENVELQNILASVAEHYHLQVTYQNESSRHIRLYLQLTESMSLDEIINLMNHFEKVNVQHEGNKLVVE